MNTADGEPLEDPSELRLERALSIAFGAGRAEGVEVLTGALPWERFELRGELGSGAMGVVTAARDVELDRDVALKILRPEVAGRAGMVDRFLEEAQIEGQLQHPGIVPVYGLGLTEEKRPFIAMKLVQGRTLAALLSERSGPSEQLQRFLGLFESICRTVAYAHARGVLHRDLKPSNVMIGELGEVLVVDWGVAKVLGREELAGSPDGEGPVVHTRRSGTPGSASLGGSVIGTPAYMPPEQASGRIEDVDERADVFGLGAILCEILTGEPPYRRESGELLHLAREALLDDARERLDASGADEEVIALCQSCLAPRGEDRPRHAGVLATAIDRHLADLERRTRAEELLAAEEAARAETDRARARRERRRAARDRRVRRLTRALAVAALAAALLAAVGTHLRRREARELQLRTTGQVAAAMRAAALFEGESRWAEAATRASEALTVAREGSVDADTLARAEQLQGRVRREELEARAAELRAAEDAALLARIDDVAIHHPSNHDRAKMDSSYAAAFRELGIDVEVLEPGAAAAAIAGRSEPSELAAALEEWTWFRRQSVPGRDWKRLLDVVRAADPDPWRDRVRDAAARDDTTELRSLAAAAETEAPPVRTLALLGTCLGRGDRAAAIDFLRAARERHPDDFRLAHELGRLAYRSDPPDLEEAACGHLAALALQPQSACDLLNLGHVLRELGDTAGAIAALERVVELRPDYAGAYHNLGILRKPDDPAGAERLHRRALELDPDFAPAYGSLGVIHLQRGEVERAHEMLSRAVELRPGSADLHGNLGNALGARGDLDGAIAAYERSIELGPESAIVHVNLGLALKRRGDVEGALDALRRAIELDPSLPSAHANLGVILCDHTGDFAGAEAAFRAAIALDPTAHRYRSNLGIALVGQRRFEEAVASFEEAIELEPGYASAHLQLGRALTLAGRLEEAASAYRAAIELEPGSYAAHVNLGALLCDRLDDPAGAETAFRDAIAIDPSDPRTHFNLGVALQAQGRFEEAASAYRSAAELRPDRGNYWGQCGYACLLAGDCEEAIEALERAASLQRTRPAWAWFHLAAACEKLGRVDEARAWLEKAAKWVEEHAPVDEELDRLLAETEALLSEESEDSGDGR